MEDNSRHKGRVKFFNSTKGFGFILPDAKEENDAIEEVFVHHTAIHNDGGFKSLAEGEEVEYDLVQGPKGMQASNVTGPQGVSVQGDPRAQRQYYPNPHAYRNNNNNRGGAPGGPYNGGDPYASPFGYGALQGYQYMQQQPMHYSQYGGNAGAAGGFSAATNSISPQLQPQQFNGYMMYPPHPNAGTTNQPQFYENSGMTSSPIPPSQQQQQQQQQQTIATPPPPLSQHQNLSTSNNNNDGN
ncbi:hypothetical protein HMPREF1544_07552 [Mucor circinelloides 1006PhL]|uniref:CSD domain-containing protein n=1 Tax=Mucor circinelloides f. circinelloides (strain 1006PhL) TaxID=1220926 RepID=S2K0H7_MUCC1|nr:hypothetical protein HMPREF1544_07552 [Mucor circinelloides 1006PhL]